MRLKGSDRFQVEPGDLWKAGPHLLRCGDLLERVNQDWLIAQSPAWVYSDPPWGPGNAKFWRTANDQGDFPVDYDALLEAFARVAHSASVGAFVEMGLRWQVELQRAMQPWTPHRTWTTVYGKPPRPNLVQFYPHPDLAGAVAAAEDPSGMTGEAVTRTLLTGRVQVGDVLIDPCMGLGMTLRVGHELGALVRGNELHPARLSRCLDWAARQGLNVERIEWLG